MVAATTTTTASAAKLLSKQKIKTMISFAKRSRTQIQIFFFFSCCATVAAARLFPSFGIYLPCVCVYECICDRLCVCFFLSSIFDCGRLILMVDMVNTVLSSVSLTFRRTVAHALPDIKAKRVAIPKSDQSNILSTIDSRTDRQTDPHYLCSKAIHQLCLQRKSIRIIEEN